MSDIINLNKEYKKRNSKKWGISLAEQEFIVNIASLDSIQHTDGYKTIKKYWERELKDTISFITQVDSSAAHEVARAQAKIEIAQKFLWYLNGLESSIKSTSD